MKPRKVCALPLGVPPRLRARHRPHRVGLLEPRL